MSKPTTLIRETFSTSRTLEYFSEEELNRQMGAAKSDWSLMLIKELVDNALDACEAAGVAPKIVLTVESDAVTVADNGSGLPAKVIEGSLDYLVRVSDKTHYVSPTRGQLGNALKLLWAAPFVACGEAGWVEVRTPEATHEVRVGVNRLEQRPDITQTISPALVKKGSAVTIHWPKIASYPGMPECRYFYQTNLGDLLHTFALLNPHATFVLNGNALSYGETTFEKWLPGQPTSAHWYTAARLRDLIAGIITNGQGACTIRDFVGTFDGLSATAKRKLVTQAANLSGACLNDLVSNGDVAMPSVYALLSAMRNAARPVKPERLGVLGREYFKQVLANPESVRCAPTFRGVTQNGLPFVLEVALGYRDQLEDGLLVMTGLNFSPTLNIPFAELSDALSENRIDRYDPVEIVVHLTCPLLEFTDDGKTRLKLPQEIAAALKDAVAKVAKEHKKSKKRMERLDEQHYQRARRWARQQHVGLKEASYNAVEAAYLAASGNGRYPANVRQIMYSARPDVQNLTGGKFYADTRTFTSGVLPEFIEAHPELTKDWDVVFDARGQLNEPYTARRVDLGTLQVRNYTERWTGCVTGSMDFRVHYKAPTCGPANRFAYALFIEKEGFYPLLDAARIADRYGVAIMSTKGMSTVAARQLVDDLSGAGVTILVAHDFDKAGFSIAATLAADTQRYKFKNEPRVIDIGLRLDDVLSMNLQAEEVDYGSTSPVENLLRNGATLEEIEFMCGDTRGKRVELNAMTSEQFVAWLERKFAEVGVHKVIPDDKTLSDAYHHARKLARLQHLLDEAIASLPDEAINTTGLAQRLLSMTEDTEMSWDEALWLLAYNEDTDKNPTGEF